MKSHGPNLDYGVSRSARPRTSTSTAEGTPVDPLDWLSELLETGGVAAALAYLNSRVEHMSTAIYRLVGHTLHMDAYYDAMGGQPLAVLRSVPLGDSFCQYAIRDGAFVTEESMFEGRMADSPLRPFVSSYVGFALTAQGGYLGALCHFDIVPRSISSEEFDFQKRAAALVSRHLVSG